METNQPTNQVKKKFASAETFLQGIVNLEPKIVNVPNFGDVRIRMFSQQDREQMRQFQFLDQGRAAFLLERGLMQPTGDEPLFTPDQVAQLMEKRNPLIENLSALVANANAVGKGIEIKNVS